MLSEPALDEPEQSERAIQKLHGRKCTKATVFPACLVPSASKPTIPPVQCPPAGHPVTAAGLLDTACRSALDRSRAPVRYPVPTCTCTVVRHEKFLTTAHRPHLSCADAPPVAKIGHGPNDDIYSLLRIETPKSENGACFVGPCGVGVER